MRKFWVETHNLLTGKKDCDGNRFWPQVYESPIKGTVPVVSVDDVVEHLGRLVDYSARDPKGCAFNVAIESLILELSKPKQENLK